ncbi:PREDICTED: 26S proteasome non-ATPase regulatory subunit 5 [Polistes canadensis]|uniref:26S proteasome non-ATPase regulatory subunit 5 n=1 Tax=Polistes canadensis TaxID=91411 RepID=UPI000718AEFC|nr:PREDICTED: 26S proteasome non-ATPase regulatory subunit 5 [Polistes canadensis]
MEWFQEKVHRLVEVDSNEEKKDILLEMQIKWGNCNVLERRTVVENLDAGPLISLLLLNKDIVDRVCVILTMVYDGKGEIYKKYPDKVLPLIDHSDSVIRMFILRQLLLSSNDEKMLPSLIADVNLIVAVINRISEKDEVICAVAKNFITQIGQNPNGVKTLYHGEPLRTLAKLVVKNDHVSFHVYDVIISIATISKENLEATIQSGFLSSLINILQDNDILLQLNAINSLTPLALTEEGLNYLEQQEVLTGLFQKMTYTDEKPMSNIFTRNVMKFFGNIAQLSPNEMFLKYPAVVLALFKILDNEDLVFLDVALDTLGYIATNMEGKYALQTLGDSMLFAMKKIAEIIQGTRTTLKISALNNLNFLINVPKTEQDNRILSLTKSWFNALCDDPLGLIVKMSKQPFIDIRFASLEVLVTVASQAWGQEYIFDSPGLIEFLLDRNIETFKLCKELKYKIVQCLSEAESYVFEAGTMKKLKQFVNEGPFYVETYTEVGFESAM